MNHTGIVFSQFVGIISEMRTRQSKRDSPKPGYDEEKEVEVEEEEAGLVIVVSKWSRPCKICGKIGKNWHKSEPDEMQFRKKKKICIAKCNEQGEDDDDEEGEGREGNDERM